MFYITFPDHHGSNDCYHFDTVEDAQYALQRLYDAEEDSPSLSRRDAIASLEQQLEAHLTAAE